MTKIVLFEAQNWSCAIIFYYVTHCFYTKKIHARLIWNYIILKSIDPIRESRTHRANQIANIYSNIASEYEKQIFETQSNTVARCRVSFFSSHFLRHQWLTWIIEQSRKTNRRKYSTKSIYSRFVLADIL